ncbi:LysR family transcriptional regulator [Salicibibacter cibarius]|uniref:LysR family transcriptional regulator n=1 Tax=Salicibibacter cibarius TaxID=2743000 RepID=A0A7T6Z3E9_9BACI|nr:LysR family transcriptional regulator [Salicibibacter cibarius]QQK75686.1 LysR family transcriptional regulator [Salicibibacter cibarius]
MNFRELEVFRIIAEYKSFTLASEQLYISQPSLSKTIKKLEEKLNAELFDRSNRSLQLTDEGKLLYNKTLIILREVKDLEGKLQNNEGQISGLLRIGIPQILGSFFFPKISKYFKDHYPHVEIVISEEGSLLTEKRVHKGELDAAIAVLPIHNEQLQEQVISDEPFVACLPYNHSLINEKTIQMKQLQDETWIMFDRSFALRKLLEESCYKSNFRPNTLYSTTQWDLLLSLVEAGLGITVIPKPVALKWHGSFIIRDLSDSYISWRVGLITNKKRHQSHALKALVRSIHELY